MPVYQPIERLDQITENRYEAVLVAAKHARHLNTKRLAKLARLEDGTVDVDIEARKMTAVALREVLEGKVKFERADTK
ncbi:MAG: DNA-directed RNA polymerase subunit omega [candidate division Zixibacteria bacterium]|nr:DNA-directed RNA polymerase subunit omega [candidate division Zixibacteria bacterium]